MYQDGCASNSLAGKMGAGPLIMRHEDRGPDSRVTESKAERSIPLERAEGSQAGSHVVMA